MNASVRTFMNPTLVYLREGDRSKIALKPILEFGITAVPVLDDAHKPIGVVSLRDIVGPSEQRVPSREQMSEPALTIAIDATILDAAHALARANVHHLVVVDANGCAAGMLSSLDVVRALIGLEASHPKTIETFDAPVTRP